MTGTFHVTPAFRRRREAFALILVLVLLSLMTIIAVAYLSSMSSERATSSAFAGRVRAEQAAQAAVDSATGILRDYVKAFPDSATTWDTTQCPVPTPTSTSPPASTASPTPTPTPPMSSGTTLYLRAMSTPAPAASPSPSTLPDPNPGVGNPATYSNAANFASGNGPNNGYSAGKDARNTFVLPLVSGATVQLLANKQYALSPSNSPITSTNSTNLNTRRFVGDTQGWIGTSPTYNYPTPAPILGAPDHLPMPVTARWVEITQQYTGTASPAPAMPVVARYAFWVEDESFRTNINYAGTGYTPPASPSPTPNFSERRDNAQNFALNPTDVNMNGLLNALPVLGGTMVTQTIAQNIIGTRNNYPLSLFPDSLAYTHAAGLTAPLTSPSPTPTLPTLPVTVSDALRFLTTTQSAALNLTRHGTQRVNLNTVVYPPSNFAYPNPTNPTNAQTQTVTQNQIDKIVQTVLFHAPNFGQRFYRLYWLKGSSPNPPIVADPNHINDYTTVAGLIGPNFDPRAYVYKLAANLHDYIDADALPTVIAYASSGKGQVFNPADPTQSFYIYSYLPDGGYDGYNCIWAVGKDSAPVLTACATRFTAPPATNTATNYNLYVDYYFAFWNMTNRTVSSTDLGPNPYILVNYPPPWLAYNNSSVYPYIYWNNLTDNSGNAPLSSSLNYPYRNNKIDLTGVTFPPGAVTVVTTDPNWQSASVFPTLTDSTAPANQTEAAKHFVVCKILPNTYYKNPTDPRSYAGKIPTGTSFIGLGYRDGLTTSPAQYSPAQNVDFETEVVVGSDKGYIDSMFGAMPVIGGTISISTAASLKNSYGGYLQGNISPYTITPPNPLNTAIPSQSGDPRTNNEQLDFNGFFSPYSYGPRSDQTGYLPFDTNFPPNFGLPNYFSTDPANPVIPWSDSYWYPSSKSAPTVNGTVNSKAAAVMTTQNAPMVIANAPLTSIGQLGDIFDPARLPATSSSSAAFDTTRGGGRTYRIGQHDDLYDGVPFSNSSTWASWRLTDIFSTTDAIEQPGLININGLARDNGAALKAAYQGFVFQPQSSTGADPTVHGDAPATPYHRLRYHKRLASPGYRHYYQSSQRY